MCNALGTGDLYVAPETGLHDADRRYQRRVADAAPREMVKVRVQRSTISITLAKQISMATVLACVTSNTIHTIA